jgi:transposase InsO family protein
MSDMVVMLAITDHGSEPRAKPWLPGKSCLWFIMPGNCYDNAVVETFFKTLKSELVWRTVFQTRAEAKKAIGRYIDGFYNPVRRHSTLDYVSPVQFERLAG